MTNVFRFCLPRLGWLLLLFMLAPPARGQGITAGSVSGVVVDAAGAGVAGVRLTLRERPDGAVRAATTGRDGRFSFALTAAGEYQLRAEVLGYRPAVLPSLLVRPGERAELSIPLSVSAPPVERVDTLPGRAARPPVGDARWYSGSELEDLPLQGWGLNEIGALSSLAGPSLEVEGLPAYFTQLLVDGVPVSAVQHPSAAGVTLPVIGYPRSAVGAVRLAASEMDVELGGSSGAVLNAITARGGNELKVRTFGSWSHLGDRATGAPGVEAEEGMRGGFVVSGPIVRDSASFLLGLDAWRSTAPVRRLWAADSAASRAIAIARDSAGVNLAEQGRLKGGSESVVSGFGRLAWQLSPVHSLDVSADVTALPEGRTGIVPGREPGPSTSFEGHDLLASATLTSRFSERVSQELRLGFSSSSRDFGRDDPILVTDAGAPSFATRILTGGLAFGADPSLPPHLSRTSYRASETLHLRYGAHALKVGAQASLSTDAQDQALDGTGIFLYSGPEEFASGTGYFEQTLRPFHSAGFRVPRFAGFVQDRWYPAPGLELQLGARLDYESLPTDQAAIDTGWVALTGTPGLIEKTSVLRVNPRAEVTWDVGARHEWVVNASGGFFSGEVDPGVWGPFLTQAGGLRVRRGLGPLGSWPDLPSDAQAPEAGRAVTLLAPDFTTPQTARAGVGVTRAFGARTSVSGALRYRRTANLPRRVDLNLRPSALWHDANGRPVYGDLQQSGRIVVAGAGTNRRFGEHDAVTGVNADGWSEYRGVTLSIDHRPAAGLRLFGSYTYSQTRDNWLSPWGAGMGTDLPPFPGGEGPADWDEGVSDFDLPHRLVAGAEVAIPAPLELKLAGLYRYRSGEPFTPGLPAGVDANGDGSIGNDPAFIDSALLGPSGLLREWECLGDQVGEFAARNSCRAPGAASLDLRLTAGLRRQGGLGLALTLDALNLLSSGADYPDRALYLVDPDGALATDAASGTVTLPLLPNPNFGKPLARLTEGRTFRLGLRLTY